jgi:hypothetical protein
MRNNVSSVRGSASLSALVQRVRRPPEFDVNGLHAGRIRTRLVRAIFQDHQRQRAEHAKSNSTESRSNLIFPGAGLIPLGSCEFSVRQTGQISLKRCDTKRLVASHFTILRSQFISPARV